MKLEGGRSTEEKVRSKAYKAANLLGERYPVLKDWNESLKEDQSRLYSTGKNGRDFYDEYAYIRSHATKEYRKVYNQWSEDSKIWNTQLSEIGLDNNRSSYSISQLLNYLDSHK